MSQSIDPKLETMETLWEPFQEAVQLERHILRSEMQAKALQTVARRTS